MKAFILLIVMLVPLALETSGGDTSLNYSWAVLAPFLFGLNFNANKSVWLYAIFLLLASIAGLVSTPLIYKYNDYLFLRHVLSVVVALLPLTILFSKCDRYLFGLKKAVILVSLMYSVMAIIFYFYYVISGYNNVFEIKGLMGDELIDWPQRYVLVLFAGLFFLVDNSTENRLRWLWFLIILTAVLLTFLRAVYVSLLVGFFVFILKNYFYNKKMKVETNLWKWIFGLSLILLGWAFLNLSSIAENVYQAMEYSVSSAAELAGGDYENNISNYTRYEIFEKIIELVSVSPIYGTGGAGIYVFAPGFGSAHGQFNDFLARYGVVGFVFFSYFTLVIFNYGWKYSPGVAGLVVTYSIFGFFHETIKYSYCALIFYFLLNVSFARKKNEINSKRVSRSNLKRVS